jgi:hypothetical protein
MLTADAAVDSITKNAPKQAIWSINTEASYHEEKLADDEDRYPSARS